MSKHPRPALALSLLGLGLYWGLAGLTAARAQAQPPPAQVWTLDDCVRMALQHSPQLAASQEGVVGAQADVRLTRSDYAPQLSLSASQGLRGSHSTAGAAQSGDGANLSLSMTLWRSGRNDSLSAARANLVAARYSHSDTRLALAQQVANDYYNALAAMELIDVAQAGVDAAQENRRQVLRQIEAGDVAESEAHTVDDDLAQANLALIDARCSLRTIVATLKTDMGVPYDTPLQCAPGALSTPDEPSPSEAEAVRAALDSRPDVRRQRAVIQARESAVRVARATYGPSFEVGGECLNSFPDWSSGGATWGLTVSGTWPLLDGGQKSAAVALAQANLRSGQADMQALTDQVALEVQTALAELDRSRESIKASEDALAAARSRLESAEVRYREELGILLEVTEARADLTNTEAQSVEARYAFEQARIALLCAMGSLPLPDLDEEGQP